MVHSDDILLTAEELRLWRHKRRIWLVVVLLFVLGIVATLLAMACAVYIVSAFGLYPIGADNPPSSLERRLAGRALNA